ncbi:MAG: CoA transferase [Deltaproteobacteria bacterium]|nr:CoA transferase [Deltaproteobacteria bacterium]
MARHKSGEGAKVETSLLQATLSFIGEAAAGYLRTGRVPDRTARVKNAHAFAFAARDRLPLVIHCSVPEKFWIALLKAAERMDLADDERFKTRDNRREHYAELERELAKTFAARDRGEWLRRLEEHDVPAGPLYNMGEVLADPQVEHLGLVEELEHPEAGKLRFVGPSVNYHGLSKREAKPPPLLGEHTAAVLTELGYGQAVIKDMAKQGIIKLVKESESY